MPIVPIYGIIDQELFMNKKIDKYGNIYVSETFRLGSKTNTRTVCKLGKVSDLMEKNGWTEEQVINWADSEVRRMTEEKKNSSGSAIIKLSKTRKIQKDRQNTFQVGYLFLQSIYSSLGIARIMNVITDKYRFAYSLNDILSCLVFSRILDPASKRKTFLKRKAFPEKWDFSANDIYRSLDVLADNADSIQKKLYQNSKKVLQRDTSVLYYDCTNFYFEIEQEDEPESDSPVGLRSYGPSKEHRPNPVVQMGLFTDRDGIPVRMSVFPGRQSEQISIDKDTFREISRDYGIGRFVYCADAGLGSTKIKTALDSYAFPCSYIVTQSIRKMAEPLKKWSLGEDGDEIWNYRLTSPETEKRVTYSIKFSDIDKDPSNTRIYYREKWTLTKENREERVIVTYSPVYAHYLATLRENQLKRALRKLQTHGKRKRQTDPGRFIREIHLTGEGEEAKKTTYEIDVEKVAEEARYDGFYCVTTDLEDDIDDIIAVNKERWQIEACFRQMKSSFDARPVYVHTENHIKAHFLICYIALLVFTLLRKIVGASCTDESLLDTLREMKVLDLNGQGYTPAYTRTDLTDQLEEIFDLPMSTEYISEAKLQQLIARTKKKRKIAHF